VTPEESDPGFTLQVPADPAFMATARMFTSAVGRQWGADESTIEDLKLAVSEAVTGSMAAPSQESVRITAHHRAPRLRFEISGPDPVSESGPGAGSDLVPTGLELIQALFEDAEMDAHEREGFVIRFSIPLSG
jgi:Histidine kinase-like ATPase domain